VRGSRRWEKDTQHLNKGGAHEKGVRRKASPDRLHCPGCGNKKKEKGSHCAKRNRKREDATGYIEEEQHHRRSRQPQQGASCPRITDDQWKKKNRSLRRMRPVRRMDRSERNRQNRPARVTAWCGLSEKLSRQGGKSLRSVGKCTPRLKKDMERDELERERKLQGRHLPRMENTVGGRGQGRSVKGKLLRIKTGTRQSIREFKKKKWKKTLP